MVFILIFLSQNVPISKLKPNCVQTEHSGIAKVLHMYVCMYIEIYFCFFLQMINCLYTWETCEK